MTIYGRKEKGVLLLTSSIHIDDDLAKQPTRCVMDGNVYDPERLRYVPDRLVRTQNVDAQRIFYTAFFL